MRTLGRASRAVPLLVVVLVAGCSSTDEARRCVGGGGAEVCAEDIDGSIQIQATGLLPDSEIVVEAESVTPPQAYPVGADGTPEGLIAIITASSDDPVRVRVRAVSAAGGEFEGELGFR